VLDLAFVHKAANGDVDALELEDEGSEVLSAFQALTHERGGLVNTEDLMDIGEALDNDSSAAILVWEDLWAARFKDAVIASGGVLVDIQRVPYEIVDAAIAYKESAAIEA
jgi:hypothetical protein